MKREMSIIRSWIESLQNELYCLSNQEKLPNQCFLSEDDLSEDREKINWELSDTNQIEKRENGVRIRDVFMRFVEKSDINERMD